jgi:hypothetical protein
VSGRLSTCGICGATIRQAAGGGYEHVVATLRNSQHRPEPDDSAVSGPDADDLEDE